jgi:hypothetical protein
MRNSSPLYLGFYLMTVFMFFILPKTLAFSKQFLYGYMVACLLVLSVDYFRHQRKMPKS